MSGRASASKLRNDMTGGVCGGYDDAKVSRIRCICLDGAAHGVWKDITAREAGGREERCEWNWVSSVISVTLDMAFLFAPIS